MYFSARRPRNVAIFSYKSAGKTDFATTAKLYQLAITGRSKPTPSVMTEIARTIAPT